MIQIQCFTKLTHGNTVTPVSVSVCLCEKVGSREEDRSIERNEVGSGNSASEDESKEDTHPSTTEKSLP